MEKVNDIRTFNPSNRKSWRAWLAKNYRSKDPVCVVIYNKNSETPNVTYAEVVEEALCYGWIDNKGLKRDAESMYLQLTPRKATGNWSKLNRSRAERMISEGKMTQAGQVFIDIAKKNGKWDAALAFDVIPPDLQKAFEKKKKAWRNFEAFAPSAKRMIIQWIGEAKREETRKTRVAKTVELAAQNVKAH
jgi:uncharacterized protein YdeI (YjbR/CyaY-like superfamily)